MDLRHRPLTPAQLQEIQLFIQERKLAYQPFEFTDTLQVGEGQKFSHGEFADRCGNVLWEGHPSDVADLITKDSALFKEANRELRGIYDGIVDFIVKNVGEDIANLSFAEFGCNTGYFMHSLAARGAKKTTGYDFTENSAVFRWFNNVLGIAAERNEFRFAEWDSFNHQVRHATFDEADVCLSIAVTCHLADPLHHLAFLCSKARQAVFFWCPVNESDDLSISFGTPGKYPNALSFPIDFDNAVKLSSSLFRLTLERCGFGKLIEIEAPNVSPKFLKWFKAQRGFLALRTSAPTTVYTNGPRHRDIPADAPTAVKQLKLQGHSGRPVDCVEQPEPCLADAEGPDFDLPISVQQGYRGFNVVRFRGQFIGLAQALGSVDVAMVDNGWLPAKCAAGKACIGTSLEDANRQIDQLTIEDLHDSVRQLQVQLLVQQQLASQRGFRQLIAERYRNLRGGQPV